MATKNLWESSKSQLALEVLSVPKGRGDPTGMRHCSIFGALDKEAPFPISTRTAIVAERLKDRTANRAMGCLVGNAVGDAVGAPLEFMACDTSDPNEPNEERGRVTKNKSGEWVYENEFNKFTLERGQWTDDAAMALCLADSLLVHDTYHGGDARIRWLLWWSQGLNNAFRFSQYRRSSVGLGGNIACSLRTITPGSSVRDVPWIYMPNDPKRRNDAGNGSLMRNGAVPIRFRHNVKLAEMVATLQTKGTHPGNDAAACAMFLTFFCVRAIEREDDELDVKSFTDRVVEEFVQLHYTGKVDDGMQKLRLLLENKASTLCHKNDIINLNWKQETLPIWEAIENRGGPGCTWNGPHPVLPGYQGAWSMDGMSMALWGVYHSSSFEEAIVNTVNLLGDADTTAAIAGQMAGAFYGASAIPQQWLDELNQWDKHEIALRALLLHDKADTMRDFDQDNVPAPLMKKDGSPLHASDAQVGNTESCVVQ